MDHDLESMPAEQRPGADVDTHATYPGEGAEKTWEHKLGEGCKKVGHGG